MSVDLNIYLRRASMPSPIEWQRAISAAGFPVEIDTAFDVDESTGFRPCKYVEDQSGFEYFARRITASEANAAGAPEGCDFLVTLTTHSDLLEFAASLAASSALCRFGDGLLVDPQSGESYNGNSAVEWAKAQLKDLEADLS